MNSQKGFNLIELLVVIAIIGVLSTIALASLNSARIKSADASVRGGLKSALDQATILYETNNNYTGVCLEPSMVKVLTDIEKNVVTGTSVTCETGTSGASVDQSIAISAELRGGGTWCVDDSGTSAALVANAGVCQ